MHKSDRVAGAIVGVTGVLALMWLLIPALASSPGWPARAVRDSAVARAIDRIAPDPPPDAETLGRLVGDETFPEVFDTLTSPDAGSPPQHGVPADVAQRVSNSVVKVEGTACDRVQEGTGFVAAPGIIVTNAHVVAGEQRTKVFTVDGTQIDTDVDRVRLQPRPRGAAGLATSTRHHSHAARATSTTSARSSATRAAVRLRESSMRIAEQIVARGTNIEHTAATRREVFVLAAVTEPGDSGAPVVDQSGKVLGVLFAFDLSRPTTAYALTTTELNAVLDPVLSTPHHTQSPPALASPNDSSLAAARDTRPRPLAPGERSPLRAHDCRAAHADKRREPTTNARTRRGDCDRRRRATRRRTSRRRQAAVSVSGPTPER